MAETELEVVFEEVAVADTLFEVLSPPSLLLLFPPVCDGVAEASVLVLVPVGPSRLYRWIAHRSATAKLIQKQSSKRTRIFDRITAIVMVYSPRYTRSIRY